tara:strand:+ start:16962 stop:17195 length:234 start_codon:yes stop_codon:yes gene_type:complete
MDHPVMILRNRLLKIGITIEMFSNYPWIYLDKVNGNAVKEKYFANHGFTIGFNPAKLGDVFSYTDLTQIFKIIRKYK